MARPKKDVGAALAVIVKDLIQSNQNISDIGIMLGVLGKDSTKWLDNLKAECKGNIDEFIELASQRADIELIAAAAREGLGYDYEEIETEYIKKMTGYDKKNKPIIEYISGRRKGKKKRFRGNESLLKFILKNRMPEYFQEVQKVEVNKKTIEIKEIAAREIEEVGRKLLESIEETEK
jgi:hypothetical protein